MNIPLIVFYCFSALLIGSSVMVVISQNPVRGVLFLILGFFATSVLWMLLQAEFLSLALIFVYVGAVMTLFLFVVMMLNIKQAAQAGFVRYMGFALLVMLILIGIMLYSLHAQYLDISIYSSFVQKSSDYSNVKALGVILYTKYAYAFEIGGILLLVSILSAIGLAFRGRKADSKSQRISEQLMANKSNRLTIVQRGFKKL